MTSSPGLRGWSRLQARHVALQTMTAASEQNNTGTTTLGVPVIMTKMYNITSLIVTGDIMTTYIQNAWSCITLTVLTTTTITAWSCICSPDIYLFVVLIYTLTCLFLITFLRNPCCLFRITFINCLSVSVLCKTNSWCRKSNASETTWLLMLSPHYFKH